MTTQIDPSSVDIEDPTEEKIYHYAALNLQLFYEVFPSHAFPQITEAAYNFMDSTDWTHLHTFLILTWTIIGVKTDLTDRQYYHFSERIQGKVLDLTIHDVGHLKETALFVLSFLYYNNSYLLSKNPNKNEVADFIRNLLNTFEFNEQTNYLLLIRYNNILSSISRAFTSKQMFFSSPIPYVYKTMLDICFRTMQHRAASDNQIFLVSAYAALIDIVNALPYRQNTEEAAEIFDSLSRIWDISIDNLKQLQYDSSSIEMVIAHLRGSCNCISVFDDENPKHEYRKAD